MSRPHLLDALADRVLLCDGAMGSRVQAMTLDLERDYLGQENCTEILNLSRPDLVREIHEGYFAAGADMVETNSFGGSPVTLAEFGLEDRAVEINRTAATLAREAADRFADGRHRWVLGSVGPGTKLPTLGNIGYDPLEAALALQCGGLIEGGVDAILIETCQDPLQIKAAVNGAKQARARLRHGHAGLRAGDGGDDGHAAGGSRHRRGGGRSVQALDVPLIGLNCATGPQEMAEHVAYLARNWPGLISCLPNAGLPELHDGHTHYPLGPAEMATWLDRFLDEDGINLIGGCCGTGIAHIEALDAMLRRRGGRPVAAGAGAADGGAGRLGRVALRAGAAAAGERVLRGRRALQRQRLQALARAAGEPATGTAAWRWGASRRPRAATRSTCARPSSGATRRGR